MTLELVDLHVAFGATVALDGLSFAVPPGQVFGFLGPNGSGKTTAMRVVFGIARADRGEVRWEGRAATAADRLSWGYMPEERGLYPSMRVLDQLVFLGRLHGLSTADAKARAGRWLDLLGLGERAGDQVDALSLGNQQRVQLAAALLHEPGLLVLDEPFSGLDPVGIDALAGVLRQRADDGATILFSSHQLDLVEHLCDAVAVVARGRTVSTGTVDRLTSRDQLLVVQVATDQPGWAGALAGVEVVDVDEGAGGWRLRLGPGGDPQAVLDAARAAGRVTRFATERRRLSELFREAVA